MTIPTCLATDGLALAKAFLQGGFAYVRPVAQQSAATGRLEAYAKMAARVAVLPVGTQNKGRGQRGRFAYQGVGNEEENRSLHNSVQAFAMGHPTKTAVQQRERYFEGLDPKYWQSGQEIYNNSFPPGLAESDQKLLFEAFDELTALGNTILKSVVAELAGNSLAQVAEKLHDQQDHTLEAKCYFGLSESENPHESRRSLSPNSSMLSRVTESGADQRVRLKAHQDLSSLTLLLQHPEESSTRLEVWSQAESRWVYAPPQPGAVLVNTGKAMQALIPVLVPVAHRVVDDEASSRLRPNRTSLVLFFQPNWHTAMSPLDEPMGEDAPTFGDWTPFM